MNEPQTDEEYEAAVAKRVRMIGAAVVGGALLMIALSALTLKSEQVDDIPRAPTLPSSSDEAIKARSHSADAGFARSTNDGG